MRRVVSVFLPNFQTDRQLSDRVIPRSDSPLVVAAHDGRRQVLAGVCPAGRALGLRPGMALAHAQAMLPGLVVADADPAADAACLLRLSRGCHHYTPLAAPDAPDGLWLDIAGCAHLHPAGEAGLLANLRARLFRAGFFSRIAVADAPGTAHALARYGTADETVLPPGADTLAALGTLPVAALRLPTEIVAKLRRIGLDRVAQLAASPRAPLARRFGPVLLARLDQALGRTAEPLDPVLPDVSLAHRLAFAEPLLATEFFAAAIHMLAREVCAQLEKAGQGARKIDLLFERVDHSWQAIRLGMARPGRDPHHIVRLLSDRLDTVDPGLGVEAMRLRVALAEKLDWTQLRAAARTGSSTERRTDAGNAVDDSLAELVDRLAGRLGAAHVYRAEPVESRIPERSVRRIPPLAPFSGRSWDPALPRPPRLLDPPQPVDAVALLPDHPPAAFTWRRLRRRIHRADGPERVHGEWWKRGAEVSAVRDYFAVEDASGRRYWLYRRGDGVTPEAGDLRWFVQGIG